MRASFICFLLILILLTVSLVDAHNNKKANKRPHRPQARKQGQQTRIPPKCQRHCSTDPSCIEEKTCLRTEAASYCARKCRNSRGSTRTPVCENCRRRICSNACALCKLNCDVKRDRCFKDNCSSECFDGSATSVRSLELVDSEDQNVSRDNVRQGNIDPFIVLRRKHFNSEKLNPVGDY